MKLIFDQSLVGWVERELKTRFNSAVCLGTERGGHIGVVVLHNCNNWDGELTVYSTGPNWASYEFFKALFRHIYHIQGLERCTARIHVDNHRSIKLVERLGFKREGIMRHGCEAGDVFIYGLLKSECRWVD